MPFTFPDHPASLPSELGQYFELGASITAGDRRTSTQIVALRDECVFEHRFCPEPIFFIRSNGTPVVLPQLICKVGDFAFSWADGCGGFHGFTYRAPFSHHHCCVACPHKYLPQDSTWKIEANFLYPGGNSLGSPNLLTRLVNVAQANQMKGKLHCRTP